MRYAAKATSSILPRLLLGVSLLVVAVVGTTATLWAMGYVDLPFLKHEEPAPSHAGMVGIPMSGQAVPIYTKLTRDHLYEPTRKELAVKYVQPDQVPPRVLVSLDQIIGRVLSHDKPAGYVFTEDDFLPKGTHPGWVAGIPPGKRALTLEADKLRGAAGLKAGDHLDIVGSLAFDARQAFGDRLGLLKVPGQTGQIGDGQKRVAVEVLVQNGVVVTPITTRQVPVSSSSLTSGVTTRTRPVQEIVIAVDLKEVVPLNAALALNADILCIARSGRPDDTAADTITPGPPLRQQTVVEVMNGSKRDVMVFPPTAPDLGASKP